MTLCIAAVQNLRVREAYAVKPTIDWSRALVTGALTGAAFWATAVYAVFASEGSPVTWTTVCVIVVALLGTGIFLYRRTPTASTRCYAVGMILAPLVGLVPAAVFSFAGVIVDVVGK